METAARGRPFLTLETKALFAIAVALASFFVTIAIAALALLVPLTALLVAGLLATLLVAITIAATAFLTFTSHRAGILATG